MPLLDIMISTDVPFSKKRFQLTCPFDNSMKWKVMQEWRTYRLKTQIVQQFKV